MKISHPENIDFQSINNIIFDWGGVITNIDYHRTVSAFKKLGLKDFHEYFTQEHQNELFKLYEIGKISSDTIRNELFKKLYPGTSINDFDNAWCAMLLDTPQKNIELLKKIAPKFKIYLLSNTNDIHVTYYNKRLKEELNIDYPKLFNKVYYSHTIGKRKPNADAFEFVLNDSNLIAQRTLFIDDTEMHVNAADKLGIQAFYLHNSYTIHDIFKSVIK